MDTLSTLIVSSAVGGAAGSFIKEISSNGVRWLLELVTAQSPEMQAIARRNMENFVQRLAQRVERLEKEIPNSGSAIFNKALNHPGSALLIKSAIIDSAKTDNDDKQDLLVELIAQRLNADAEDLVSLAGDAACSIVTCLTSRQIKILSILSILHSIRPLKKANTVELDFAKKYIIKWWEDNISPLLLNMDLGQATQLDYEHLVAMGCARISIGSASLIKTLSAGFIEPELNCSENIFNGQFWYDALELRWEELGHLTPTSIGQLIGTLHRDARLQTKTQISW